MTTAMRYRSRVYVAPCDVGRGVFAARNLSAGERILEFHGRRVKASDPLNHSDQQCNLVQIDERLYLLPNPPGLFVNHSCRPNAGVVRTTVLVALRDIHKGEEIRFDYSTTMDEDAWTMTCHCGDAACRHLITDFKYLPADLQASYLDRGLVQPFIARKYKAVP